MKRAASMLLCMICVGVTSFAGLPARAENAPSVDLLVAAIQQQEASCGLSLRVNYTIDALGPTTAGNAHDEIRYARTPDLLFMEEKLGRVTAQDGQWSLRETVRCRYDRATRAYVELGTVASSGKQNATVAAQTQASRFTSEPMIDIPLFPIGKALLRERMREGAVRPAQETIDGSACWCTDIPIKLADGSIKVSVWVDPAIGFCPRQIVRTYTTTGMPTKVYTTRFADYKEVKKGVWLPMSEVVEYDNTGKIGTSIRVTDVSVDAPIAAGDVEAKIPSGTDVFLLPEGDRITAP